MILKKLDIREIFIRSEINTNFTNCMQEFLEEKSD